MRFWKGSAPRGMSGFFLIPRGVGRLGRVQRTDPAPQRSSGRCDSSGESGRREGADGEGAPHNLDVAADILADWLQGLGHLRQGREQRLAVDGKLLGGHTGALGDRSRRGDADARGGSHELGVVQNGQKGRMGAFEASAQATRPCVSAVPAALRAPRARGVGRCSSQRGTHRSHPG